MIGFLIKKAFFDGWDNLFRLVLLNVGFVASLTIPILLPGLIPSVGLSMLIAAAGFLWCAVYLSAAALSLKAVSDYGSFGFADFWNNLKASWPAGAVLGGLAFFLFIAITIIIPFYLEMRSLLGLLLGALIFWTLVLGLLSMQFFFAVRARLATKPIKIIKKCFIIFFDNPGFSFFCLLYTTATLVLSLLLALLLPGPAGALLFIDEGVRLRILKYDWLEENPPADASVKKRRAIPWDAILIEERERTGIRTFRNFIFPWKD